MDLFVSSFVRSSLFFLSEFDLAERGFLFLLRKIMSCYRHAQIILICYIIVRFVLTIRIVYS